MIFYLHKMSLNVPDRQDKGCVTLEQNYINNICLDVTPYRFYFVFSDKEMFSKQ